MRESIEQFLSFLAEERRLTPNTVAAYRNDLNQLATYLESPAGARWAASSESPDPDGRFPTREAVLGFLLHLKEKGYAPATIARKVAAVRSLFGYLRQAGLVAEDPVADLNSPEVKKPLPRAVPLADVELLLRYAGQRPGADALRDRAMLELLFATGMRVSELVMLDLDDLDLASATVRCVGRHNRVRVIPITARAREAVAEYQLHGRPALCRDPEERALFLNQRGQRLTRQGFWLIMKELAQAAGITAELTPHTLRHTFAAHRLSDGVALEELQQILGHANISTTQIYQHVRVPLRQPAPVAAPTDGALEGSRVGG